MCVTIRLGGWWWTRESYYTYKGYSRILYLPFSLLFLLLTFPSLLEFKHSDAQGFQACPSTFFPPTHFLDDPVKLALWFKYSQCIVDSQIFILGLELQSSSTCLHDIFTYFVCRHLKFHMFKVALLISIPHLTSFPAVSIS